MPVIDLHTHVLWELDDGADSFETTKEMLKSMHASGITHVACTPHAAPGFRPFDMDLYLEKLSEAQEWAKCALPGLFLLPGCEIAWTYHTIEALRQKQVPTLNGTRYALIEFSPSIPFQDLKSALMKLSSIGITPVIAHAERISSLLWHPKKALMLRRELPVHIQMNAGVLLLGSGPILNHYIKVMLSERAVDVLASDAHNLTLRPPQLMDAHKRLSLLTDSDYADKVVRFMGVLK